MTSDTGLGRIGIFATFHWSGREVVSHLKVQITDWVSRVFTQRRQTKKMMCFFSLFVMKQDKSAKNIMEKHHVIKVICPPGTLPAQDKRWIWWERDKGRAWGGCCTARGWERSGGRSSSPSRWSQGGGEWSNSLQVHRPWSSCSMTSWWTACSGLSGWKESLREFNVERPRNAPEIDDKQKPFRFSANCDSVCHFLPYPKARTILHLGTVQSVAAFEGNLIMINL